MSAVTLYQNLDKQSVYYDRHSGKKNTDITITGLSQEEYNERLKVSTTLYVGNLSFYTSESQLIEFFSKCGNVKDLIMGLNKEKKEPCGFCFVIYGTRDEAALALDCLNLTYIDGM